MSRVARCRWLLASVLIWLALPMALLAHEHDKGYGEPYELAGKRIVFTTWYWVRPGQFDYVDDGGNSVFAKRSVKALPGDPHVHWKDIDMPDGVRLFSEAAKRGTLEIKPEFPWEQEGIEITSLYQMTGKIMAWGTCKPGGNCYFESSDGGATWIRPKLGLVEFQGSKRNNLGGEGRFRGCFDPTAPPDERFKQVGNSEWTPEEFEKSGYKDRHPYQRMALEISPGKVQAVWGYTSPDGLTWKRTAEPLVVETNDGGQYVYYDPRLKKYVMIMREHMIGARAEGFPAQPKDENEDWHKAAIRLTIGRSESNDFKSFPLSETIIEPDNEMSPSESFQFCLYTTIPNAPDHHLMFPSRWIRSNDSVVIDLYASYDGKAWHRSGAPVLGTSNWGQWDGGAVWAINDGLVELGNGDWILPYRGDILTTRFPRGNIGQKWGIAKWPKGRLMGIEAPETGSFATMAFVAPGSTLRINALTESNGEIRVEAANLHGKPIPGRTFDDSVPLNGDQFHTVVKWKNGSDLGVKAGEPLVLRFKLARAKIYGLDFE